jgi:hypothetical protein
MTRTAPFVLAVMMCFEFTVSAQISSTGDPPPEPKAPTYTPEQLFGPPSPRSSSTTSDPGRDAIQTQTPPSLPRVTPQAPPPPSSCAATITAPAEATSFPGVSASQLPRAGVSADAFTRPGVSAEQLRALEPGNQARTCSPPREPVLYPEPTTPPRRIPSSIDEQ